MDLEHLLPDIPKWLQWAGLIFTFIGGVAVLMPFGRWVLLRLSRVNAHLAKWLAERTAFALAEETFKMSDPARMVAWVGGYILLAILWAAFAALLGMTAVLSVLDKIGTMPLPLPPGPKLDWLGHVVVVVGTIAAMVPYLLIENAMKRFWRMSWPHRLRRRRLKQIATLLVRAGHSPEEAAAMMRQLVANLCCTMIKRKAPFTAAPGSEVYSNPFIVDAFERDGVRAAIETANGTHRPHS